MADNIDTRVSPALDPETYRAVEGYADDTRGYVDDVVAAFNDIYMTLGKVHDARVLAESNPAWTPENRILIVSKESAKQKDRVLTRLARAERDLNARIVHTESLLSEPLTQQAGLGSLNGEVRSFVRGLDRPKREAFMRHALDTNDDATLTAVLGAQSYLSGLTPDDHAHYIRQYHSKRSPDLVRRLDLMKRVMDMLERNGPIVHLQFDKAVGAKPNAVQAITAANERAMKTLQIEPTA